MKTTDRSLSNSSNSGQTGKVLSFTPRQTGKKLVSTPLEDKCTQNRNKQYTNNILPCTYNKQTIYSQTARSPHPTVQFFSFTLGSPRWQALASFQFKLEVFRKTESHTPPYGSGPD